MNRRKAVACEGVMRFTAAFSKEGSSVFLPLDESGPIDLIVLRNSLLRVQVKSMKPHNGVLRIAFKSSNNWSVKRYCAGDIDLFAVYDHENQHGYLLPMKDFDGRFQDRKSVV